MFAKLYEDKGQESINESSNARVGTKANELYRRQANRRFISSRLSSSRALGPSSLKFEISTHIPAEDTSFAANQMASTDPHDVNLEALQTEPQQTTLIAESGGEAQPSAAVTVRLMSSIKFDVCSASQCSCHHKYQVDFM